MSKTVYNKAIIAIAKSGRFVMEYNKRQGSLICYPHQVLTAGCEQLESEFVRRPSSTVYLDGAPVQYLATNGSDDDVLLRLPRRVKMVLTLHEPPTPLVVLRTLMNVRLRFALGFAALKVARDARMGREYEE